MRRIINLLRKLYVFFNKSMVKIEGIYQIKYGEILVGKKVLITGGTSGIGLALAKRCLEEGAEVIITGRNKKKLNDVKEKLKNNRLHIIEWDISDVEIIEKKLVEILKVMKKVDILFNNAGVYLEKNFYNITKEDFDKVLDTNLKATYFMMQKISEYYIKNKIKGKIINIASIRGYQGTTEPYGISKWGIIGLTRGMAKKLAKEGIIVNGIAPGIVATGINNIDVFEDAGTLSTLNKRVALPEEIAEIGIFLASDITKHIIGEVIVCDGGETLY